jgi:mannan endo-1,4-beta-mannosidase
MMNKPVFFGRNSRKVCILCAGFLLLFAACNGENPGTGNNPPITGPEESWPYGTRTVSANAKRLMNYLEDRYTEKMISGIMDTAWTTNTGLSNSIDMTARVFASTGKYPALKGFDLIQLPYSGSPYYAGQEQIDEAIEWWEGKNNNQKLLPDNPDIHGIVAIMWHWRKQPSTNNSGNGWEFYSKAEEGHQATTFRIPWKDGELDTGSAEFQTIISDLDKVAALLKQLKDRGIPVLWRPLHEAAGNWTANNANGAWFWWGASGPAPYIALWEYMFNYFTNEKGLDNLIWVWNAQHEAWRPREETVDILGHDYYGPARNYSSPTTHFNNTKNMFPGRMVALTENGVIPDPVKCVQSNALWSWFMVWNDSGSTGFWNGESANEDAHKTYIFTHNLIVTLDKLPDLTAYRFE